MKRIQCVFRCVWTIAAVTVTGGVASAAEAPEEWKQIEAAIRQRREQCGVFSCRVATVNSTPGSRFQDETGKPVFAEDPVLTELSHQYTIDVGQVRFRDESRYPSFNEQRKDFIIRERTTVYNGTDGKHFRPAGTNDTTAPRTVDLSDVQSRELIDIGQLPLIWMYGVFDPRDFASQAITNLPELDFQFQRDGSEITASGIHEGASIEWVFDTEKDFNVVACRLVLLKGGRPDESTRNETLVTYRNNGDGPGLRWIPEGWQRSLARFGDTATTVTDFECLTAVDDGVFEVPDDYVKPGMLVARDKELKQVAPNLSLVPYTPGQPLQPRPGWPLYLKIILAVSGLAVAAFAYHRLRRSS